MFRLLGVRSRWIFRQVRPRLGQLPPQFFTTRTLRDGYLVPALPGELHASVAPGLRAELAEATGYDQNLVEVDLSKLNFIDSSGASVLVSSKYVLQAQGGQLTLVALQRQERLTFEALNEVELLDIKSTSTPCVSDSRLASRENGHTYDIELAPLQTSDWDLAVLINARRDDGWDLDEVDEKHLVSLLVFIREHIEPRAILDDLKVRAVDRDKDVKNTLCRGGTIRVGALIVISLAG